uniref:Protocadherin n=1 Tax=Octopus vulgaris TaxID=6645 RepID=A0A411DZ08_OCTVU|nr:protocadherin [Octopus vulgaris]
MSINMLVLVYIVFALFPQCLSGKLTYYVEEEKSPGTYVGDIAADTQLLDSIPVENPDLIRFSQLQQSATSDSDLFNVSRTGKLYTAKVLDAETLCIYNVECFKTIKIAVHQAGTFMRILKIKVFIKDVNDHEPKFPDKQIELFFDENDKEGTSQSIPDAVDKDVGILNSQITYQLRKNSDEPFTLSTSKRVDGRAKLEITLEAKLDRELRDNYMVQIVSKDGGFPSKEGLLNVKISVNDENDNPPVFSQSIYNVSIKHTHQMNTPVAVLSSKDLDSGRYGRVSYHFSSKTTDLAQSYFQVEENTGEIFAIKQFPSIQKLSYKLFVDAQDGGTPPLRSTAIVLITVTNQQNNPPNIDVNFVSAFSENTVTISEGIKVGSFIAYVMVTDNDIGRNGEVTCSLDHDRFQLRTMETKEYKVLLKNSVDREAKNLFNVRIICQDRGHPPLQTEKKFFIKVVDVNDVQPQFTKKTFKFLTYENEEVNFPVGLVNATDPDMGAGGQLTYSLYGKNATLLPFKITDNGFILTKRALDYERQDIYVFQVLVKDNGIPPLNNTVNVVVEVMDENDNAPYFTFPSISPFNLDVYYEPHNNKKIITLKAIDNDSPRNSFLRYKIIRGNNKQLFTINPYTGVLTFSRTVYQSDAGLYYLQCIVKDSGIPVLSAASNLSITLTVSNKTSEKMAVAHSDSDKRIHLSLVVIITLAAVTVSMAVVISISICIVRCNNSKNASHRAEIVTPSRIKNEEKYLISRTNNPVINTGNQKEMINKTTHSLKSQSHLYPENELENEWRTSTMVKKLPIATQIYSQQVAMTSDGRRLDENAFFSCDTMSSHKSSGHIWSERYTGQCEELPGMELS